MIEQVSENNEGCDTRKSPACYALSSLRWGNHVSSVNFPRFPSRYDHPMFPMFCLLANLGRSDCGTVFAVLHERMFSYVFAFVIVAWSSGIAALR